MHLRRDHQVLSFFCVPCPILCTSGHLSLLCGKDSRLPSGRTSPGESVMCGFGGNLLDDCLLAAAEVLWDLLMSCSGFIL